MSFVKQPGRYQPTRIEARLKVLLIGVLLLVLLIVSGFVVGYDVENIKQQIKRELDMVSRIVAVRSTASVLFDDSSTAENNLASFEAHPDVEWACIRTANNELFAIYQHQGSGKTDCDSFQLKQGVYFASNHVDTYQTINDGDEAIAMLQVRATMKTYKESIKNDVIFVLLLTVVVSLIVGFVLTRISRYISYPIISLSNTAGEISRNEDFSLRAEKITDDEIGDLVDSFNRMLSHIQVRDKSLVEEKERAEQNALNVIQTNKELEIQIEHRELVEKELKELNETLEQRVKERTEDLKKLNARIGEIARNAGKAEVASGVLHNVGNVLNSVNVSSTMIRELLGRSKMTSVRKLSEMLRAAGDNVADFILNDEKGREIPRFLALLGEEVENERQAMIRELNVLSDNIGHIKNIISMQQSYAGSYGVFEAVDPVDLFEDALRINMDGIVDYGIQVKKQYIDVGEIYIDKHKALQIIINLISNAKYAVIDSGKEFREIILKLESSAENELSFIVTDNGIGIDAADIGHLFEYGFKRRKGGHGFGLHHSALVANELGGSIRVHSDGLGKGATFVFIVPVEKHEH